MNCQPTPIGVPAAAILADLLQHFTCPFNAALAQVTRFHLHFSSGPIHSNTSKCPVLAAHAQHVSELQITTILGTNGNTSKCPFMAA
mmetsp:Transcript_25812/g.42990  ORF Transcript_25812/g.42990 Transcript_25812/m.42990 type:complete len:87 (+) Transcript_25812:1375-1635(+)